MAEQGPLSGQRLGEKYLLDDMIGQGGFGVVYHAQHLLLKRPQAIKILLEQYFLSAKFRERFIREARTIASLDHPNILPVHDFGIDSAPSPAPPAPAGMATPPAQAGATGNRAYLVMPYIAGGTLHSLMVRRQGPLGLNEVWKYLEHICTALEYAHTQNVVHLDLKPGNLLLHEDGRLLLTDFGLAHLVEEGAVEGSTSLQFGTPAYMAPEHLQGHPERRSDVYAAGVILYQMLTGRVPFEGSTPALVILKQFNEEPTSLRNLRPDLPPMLDGVLKKALAKDAAARYQTAAELLSDFKGTMSGRTSQAPSGTINISDDLTRPGSFHSDPTLRAEPPAGESVQLHQELAELREAVRRLSQAPAPPPGTKPAPAWPAARGRIWTLEFTAVFALIAVAGGIASIFSLNGVLPSAKAPLPLWGALLILAALAGAAGYFVRSIPLIAGLSLLFASVVTSLMLAASAQATPNFTPMFDPFCSGCDPRAEPTTAFLSSSLVTSLLLLVALLCLSFELARWRSAGLTGFLAFPVIVSVGLGLYTLGDLGDDARRTLLTIAIAVCCLFAALVCVFRGSCWSRSPGVNFYFLAGTLAFLASHFPIMPRLGDVTLDTRLLNGFLLAAYLLFTLGALLLAQRGRVARQG